MTSEAIHRAVLTTPEQSSVVHRDGIFYALLKCAGEEAPLLVALHGVTTEIQAAQALETLITPRGSENRLR
jgi:hypothetical protein